VESESIERRLAAILSADVVGYSRMMAEDEAATVRTLSAYREEIGLLVRQHGGRVVDTTGDNLLAEFPAALSAVRCAVDMQGVLKARNASLPPERRMEFRCGVHLGDVGVEGERIYGDGVNIAARLEGLAEPGGVCVSGTVYEQVEKKLSVELDDLGEKSLKNIPRPVHVYGVRLMLAESESEAAAEDLPGMGELTVPGFAGRPAIAVLPFENLSGDPEQAYFADGIAEDLITRLSAWRTLPVIARNSSFVYRGRSVDVKQVSRELGVRYVVEGSVRKAGNRVRINAQLIDATTGHHVWAERYDRELSDVFALQDEITEALLGWLTPELLKAEQQRAVHREPHDLDAWDCAQRGSWHSWRLTQEDNRKALALFERAAKLDPQLVMAFFGLTQVHYIDIFYQWTDSMERSVAELLRTAEKCAALDDKDPLGQLALGTAYSVTGPPDKMIAALERAIELNPSLALAYGFLGNFLATVCRSDEAIATLEKGMRLSPRDPFLFAFHSGIAWAHFADGRYEEAVDWARQSLQLRGNWLDAHHLLAASYAQLGRLDAARAAYREMLRVQPDFSLDEDAYQALFGGADPEFLKRFVDALRRASTTG
jgi:TolB-like protein/Flp pilus assembly protein TadD